MPLLDTSFIIDFLRNDSAATKVMGFLQQQNAPVGVCPHVMFELYQGAYSSSRAGKLAPTVDSFLQSLIVFPFAPEAAKQAARIQAEMQAQGSRLPILDLLIGCTAVHHGQTLVTRDADFHRIKGLDVLVV